MPVVEYIKDKGTFSEGFKSLMRPFGWLLKALIWIAGFLAAAYIIFFLYNYFTQGTAQAQLGDIQAEAQSRGFFDVAKDTLSFFVELPQNPGQALARGTPFTQHIEEKPGVKVGVNIEEFKKTRDIYEPGSEISARGEISKIITESVDFDQEIDVSIECKVDDDKGPVITELSERLDQTITPNQAQKYTLPIGSTRLGVNCILPKGNDFAVLDEGKTEQSRQLYLSVDFPFTSDTRFNIYFIDPESKLEADQARLNPFEQQRINDPYLDVNNQFVRIPQFNYPMAIGGKLLNLPWELGKTYFTELEFSYGKRTEWVGHIAKLDDLFIVLPYNLEIIPGSSDFIPTDDIRALPENSFGDLKAYRLKQEKIDEFNNICGENTRDEECRSKYSNIDVFYKISFRVTDIPESGGISVLEGGARAYYTFRTLKSTSIRIRDFENTV